MKVSVKGIKVNVGFELESIELDVEREDYEGIKELSKTERALQESRDRGRIFRNFIDNNMTDEIRNVISHEVARQIKESFENK